MTEACPALSLLRTPRARHLGLLFGGQLCGKGLLLGLEGAYVELVFYRSVWTKAFSLGGGVEDLVCGDDLVRVLRWLGQSADPVVEQS